MRTSARHNGFSVVEILAVISIITLLFFISLPLISSYQLTTKLRGEARELATHLRLAQQRAVAEQLLFGIVMDDTTDSYEIQNLQTAVVIKTVSLSDGIEFASITDLTDNTVQFTPTGSVVEIGEITLSNTKGQTSTLSIKPSGYVQITD